MRPATLMLAVFTTLCSTGKSQVTAAASVDPFIKAIEAMKRSVAMVSCVAVSNADPKLLTRRGSAFFISAAGEFLTAGHVILDLSKGQPPCPVPALVLPLERWQPDVPNEPLAWFPFKAATCAIDAGLDIAECSLAVLSVSRMTVPKILPVTLEWNVPPDGTQVAFTGFPFGVRDPMTVRAGVVAYRPVWRNEHAVGEVLLDRAAWPGFSGSPVYTSDGHVVGIVVAGQTDEGMAMTALRPVISMREMIDGRRKY
jgi:S1-C subfamily serine protease